MFILAVMDDKALIEKLGGTTRLAVLLGYDIKKGGVQRVNNWMRRGIPAGVKVKHQDLFLSIPTTRTTTRTTAKEAA